MALFLDSGNINQIKKYIKMGIIRGVTTNPSILSKEGITNGLQGIKKHCASINDVIKPLPLSIEVLSNDKQSKIEQAKMFFELGDNINVKISIHGPEGELHNIEVIHELESKHNIRINVTAMMSSQQCLVAAM